MNRFLKIFGTLAMLTTGLVLAAAVMPGCDKFPGNSRLDQDPEGKSYALNQIRGVQLRESQDGGLAMVMADIDGDGTREYIQGNTAKILGHDEEDAGGIKVRWEVHLPDGFRICARENNFGIAYDFNDDLVEEIYIPAVSLDGARWRLLALDPISGDFLFNQPLPTGEDRRPPSGWDGWYQAAGILDDADGQGGPAVVLVRRSGYDATGRGICAVSPVTGQVIWEYSGGAQPAGGGVSVVDLDGDGAREICLMTSAPDNLDGLMINGTSDDRSYLIVLDNRGRELVRQEQSGKFSVGELLTADLDDDGTREIVHTVLDRRAGGNSQLVVWSWRERRALARVRRAPIFQGLALVPGPRQGQHWLVTGSDNGSITRYLYREGQLAMDRQLVQDYPVVRVLGSSDLLPEAGPEIILSTGPGGPVSILNADLQVAGAFSGAGRDVMNGYRIWERQPGHKSLVVGNPRGSWVLHGTRSPGPLLAVLARVGLSLLAVALLVGVFFLGRKVGRAEPAGGTAAADRSQPQADRRALHLLYRELADINHQVVGKAKGLARLVWLLEAYASEVGAGRELEQRITQVLLDFHESVHPVLVSILKQAENAGFEVATVRATSQTLAGLAGSLQQLTGSGLKPRRVAAMRETLARDWDQVQAGFLHLHESINDYFTTDPVRMVQGMLLVRTEEFQRAGIQAKLVGAGHDGAGPLAKIDSGDLRFVVDNLMDNALRAMSELPDGRLLVQVESRNAEVILHFSDSGRGIDPALQEEIFSSRFSSRAGGGHGLYRSREILHSWGGEIQLADTRLGKGTTFIVKLLAAAGKPAPGSLQAEA